MSTRFDEHFTHSWEIHRKKEMTTPPTKFKKNVSIFKGPQKPDYRPPNKMRPQQSHSQSQIHSEYQPSRQF